MAQLTDIKRRVAAMIAVDVSSARHWGRERSDLGRSYARERMGSARDARWILTGSRGSAAYERRQARKGH